MQTEHLKYFIMVCEKGSISRAANTLYMSQSSISSAILALEKELGFKILNRSFKGVTPTMRGEILLKESKRFISNLEYLQTIVDDASNINGKIDFGIVPYFNKQAFNLVLKKTAETYPKIEISLKITRSQQLLMELQKNNLRLFCGDFSAEYVQELEQYCRANDLRCHKIDEDEVCILVNKNSPLTAQNQLTLDDLQKLSLATFQRSQQFELFNHIKNYFPTVQEFADYESALASVIEGTDNYVLISGLKASQSSVFYKKGCFKCLAPPDQFRIPLFCFFIYPNEKKITPAENAFVDIFTEYYQIL